MHVAPTDARPLTLHAAFLTDRGLSYTKGAASVQVYAAGTAMMLATETVWMHGGHARTHECAARQRREVHA
jgi:hypothetical protein